MEIWYRRMQCLWVSGIFLWGGQHIYSSLDEFLQIYPCVQIQQIFFSLKIHKFLHHWKLRVRMPLGITSFVRMGPIRSGAVWNFLYAKVDSQQRHCRAFRTVRSKTGDNIRKREEYLIKMAFMMCCAFMLTWTPYAVVSFWAAYGEANSIPLRLTLASVLIAKTSTIWNPLIYFILNKKFKPHIRLFLRTFFRYDNNAQQRRQRSLWHFCHSRSSTMSSSI
ncbi:opsin-VA-like [Saccostrea echinata]|uniref:opsin-VA-like n=1 Tax=Saccostrea echinata TaxID=191078 RepID=UPI002A8365FD|nr:opsin-VA-like [Saccostrea echinata]